MLEPIDPVLGLRDGENRVGFCRAGDGRGAFVVVAGVRDDKPRESWWWMFTFSKIIPFRCQPLDEEITLFLDDPGVLEWVRSLEIEWAPSEVVARRVRAFLFIHGDPVVEQRVNQKVGRFANDSAFLKLVSTMGLVKSAAITDEVEAESLARLLASAEVLSVVNRLSVALWREGFCLAVAPLGGGVAAVDDPWAEFVDT